MDLVVGRIPPTRNGPDGPREGRKQLEARVLHVREPRRRRVESRSGEERRDRPAEQDPPGARVLVLLVPDAHRLPPDLGDGNWRVFLTFSRKS
ncbi:MAG: hypothetical protein D6738_03845 [Acidobacteria bacterium]|nr:MAG: hypothetical protein D6738_03845 [Acidobacteriota bacterium]